MTAYFSFLRAINVGGKHKIKMANLKALYESLGLTGVKTLLQSGNVLFHSDLTATDLQALLETAILETYHYDLKILIRSAAELNNILETNPFTERHEDGARKIVFFMEHPLDEADFETLISQYSGSEEIFFQGSELYIYYTEGIGRSKLTNSYIEKRLQQSGTGRNWNTLLRAQRLLLKP
ncbi:DUF1697 domain-containing protein [Anaerolineales bacterium]